MNVLFYCSGVIAIVSTVMVITRTMAVHALLYLIVSLLAVAVIFFSLGAPFIAMLEILIYAGAIMVLFVFVIMMQNLGREAAQQEAQWLRPGIWAGPAVLTFLLALEMVYVLFFDKSRTSAAAVFTPKQVGTALLGPYALGVELVAMLLLAGLVGAYHLGRPHKQ